MVDCRRLYDGLRHNLILGTHDAKMQDLHNLNTYNGMSRKKSELIDQK